MKAIVLYSSRTGNTQKVAAAIRQGLPADTPCLPVSEAPASLAAYDCVFLGYWVDRGLPDACLLYTSDAADDGESVDLGGRRIIKKKKKKCFFFFSFFLSFFFFQAEDGIRDQPRSRGLGDVYKRQVADVRLRKQIFLEVESIG